MNKPSQKQIILKHLKRLGSISPAEAFRDYQITRLAARILDLKNLGHDIRSTRRTHPVTHVAYARYSFDKAKVAS